MSLTREQIEAWRLLFQGKVAPADYGTVNAVCDMALASITPPAGPSGGDWNTAIEAAANVCTEYTKRMDVIQARTAGNTSSFLDHKIRELRRESTWPNGYDKGWNDALEAALQVVIVNYEGQGVAAIRKLMRHGATGGGT